MESGGAGTRQTHRSEQREIETEVTLSSAHSCQLYHYRGSSSATWRSGSRARTKSVYLTLNPSPQTERDLKPADFSPLRSRRGAGGEVNVNDVIANMGT